MLTSLFSNLLSADSTATIGAIPTSYEGLSVPVFSIVFEVITLVLLIGAGIAGVLLIRHHVEHWVFPLIIGLAFNVFFQFMLFNQRFGLMIIGYSILLSRVEFFQTHEVLSNILLILIEAGFVFLALIFGMRYWKKSAAKENRPFTLGGAIAFGFSFFLITLLTSDYIMIVYQQLNMGIAINSQGFGDLVRMYIDPESGIDEATAVSYLLPLTENRPAEYVGLALEAVIMILEGLAPLAASILFYGVSSGALKKQWTFASAGLVLMVFLPTILTLLIGDSPAGIYIELAYGLVLGGISVLTILYVSANFMAEEWKALGYTRTMRRRDEEKKRKKIPKIVMPKD